MKISIENEIAQKYPDYKMGLIKISVSKTDWDALRKLITNEPTLSDKEEVETNWMSIFKDMHASDKRLPSVVALWNLIDRFGELKPINYFVDAYNFISVKHGIPMGGYDIKKLPNDELTLKHAVKGGVKFEPMGVSGQFEKLKDEAEICYYSGDVPVCRYWNQKDSDITKIEDDSTDVLIMFDALAGLVELENAMEEFNNIIKTTSTVVDIKTQILTNEKLSCEI